MKVYTASQREIDTRLSLDKWHKPNDPCCKFTSAELSKAFYGLQEEIGDGHAVEETAGEAVGEALVGVVSGSHLSSYRFEKEQCVEMDGRCDFFQASKKHAPNL